MSQAYNYHPIEQEANANHRQNRPIELRSDYAHAGRTKKEVWHSFRSAKPLKPGCGASFNVCMAHSSRQPWTFSRQSRQFSHSWLRNDSWRLQPARSGLTNDIAPRSRREAWLFMTSHILVNCGRAAESARRSNVGRCDAYWVRRLKGLDTSVLLTVCHSVYQSRDAARLAV